MGATERVRVPQWRFESCDHVFALGLRTRKLKANAPVKPADAEINGPADDRNLREAGTPRQGAPNVP